MAIDPDMPLFEIHRLDTGQRTRYHDFDTFAREGFALKRAGVEIRARKIKPRDPGATLAAMLEARGDSGFRIWYDASHPCHGWMIDDADEPSGGMQRLGYDFTEAARIIRRGIVDGWFGDARRRRRRARETATP
jgi:hypothetical protein